MLKYQQRVEIPAYTDRWMMGDRLGTVVGRSTMPWQDIHESVRPRGYKHGDRVELITVKLDISNRKVKVILDDCKLL